jgi:hypothetical protein
MSITFYFIFIFITRHTFNQQESQRPYNKSKGERGVDLYHYKWEKKEGGVSGNAAREHLCHGPISHMVGTEVSTSVNFFCFPKKGR